VGLAQEIRVAAPAGEIEGVVVRSRVKHADERGFVSELFREDEDTGLDPRQWHALVSRAGTLRGMHLHLRHWDYKVVVAGREALVLRDVRPDSPTDGAAVRLELSGDEPTSVLIPPGVAHGLYSYTDSVTMVGSSSLYDPGDEFEFRWDDPGLGVAWPAAPVHLSERDQNAQPLRSLVAQIEALQQAGESL
jgi:dTDP-4-dehydrorhamnose 3,5-epimerase